MEIRWRGCGEAFSKAFDVAVLSCVGKETPPRRREKRLRQECLCFEALRQRIGVQYHLEGLTRDELDAYLAQQLKAAGVSQSLFDETVRQGMYGSRTYAAAGLVLVSARSRHVRAALQSGANERVCGCAWPSLRARAGRRQ